MCFPMLNASGHLKKTSLQLEFTRRIMVLMPTMISQNLMNGKFQVSIYFALVFERVTGQDQFGNYISYLDDEDDNDNEF